MVCLAECVLIWKMVEKQNCKPDLKLQKCAIVSWSRYILYMQPKFWLSDWDSEGTGIWAQTLCNQGSLFPLLIDLV